MRCPAAVALLVIAFASGPSSASEGEGARNLLLNPGAESGRGDRPSVWVAATGPARPDGLRMVRTTERAHSGRASLAIAFDGPTDKPIAFNWVQPLAEAPIGRTIRLCAWIKAEGADSANVCVQCWDAKGEMLAFGSTPVFRGDQDWVEARSGPVAVPAGTAQVMVRAALTGRGKAWFDDLAIVEEDGSAVARDYTRRAGMATQTESTVAVDDALARAVEGHIVRAMPVSKDCTVLSYLPAWDHGRVDWIAVANNNEGANGGVRVLVGLPEVKAEDMAPAGRKFVLALSSRKTTVGTKPSPIEAIELTSGWAESTSWADAPDVADAPFASTVFVPGDGWKLFDVTPLIRKQAGARGRGVMLRFAREDVGPGGKWSGYEFVSREGPADRRPVLLVVEPLR